MPDVRLLVSLKSLLTGIIAPSRPGKKRLTLSQKEDEKKLNPQRTQLGPY